MSKEVLQHDARRQHGVSMASLPLIGVVRLYQATLSPLMGGHCRFHPTCSQYALDALREHGALRGSWLALRRLLRCHPFARGGFDAVPPRSDDTIHTWDHR